MFNILILRQTLIGLCWLWFENVCHIFERLMINLLLFVGGFAKSNHWMEYWKFLVVD
jgi:hypothetical protein